MLGDECELEGFCVPCGHRVGEIHIFRNTYLYWINDANNLESICQLNTSNGVLIGFLHTSRNHLHSFTFVHSLVLPLALLFYPPSDRNFFLLLIATFAQRECNWICQAVVSYFFCAILLNNPAEHFLTE